MALGNSKGPCSGHLPLPESWPWLSLSLSRMVHLPRAAGQDQPPSPQVVTPVLCTLAGLASNVRLPSAGHTCSHYSFPWGLPRREMGLACQCSFGPSAQGTLHEAQWVSLTKPGIPQGGVPCARGQCLLTLLWDSCQDP